MSYSYGAFLLFAIMAHKPFSRKEKMVFLLIRYLKFKTVTMMSICFFMILILETMKQSKFTISKSKTSTVK